MLGLLLIYFLGKSFYDLAGTYGKNQIAFGILGVVSYYVGTFFAGVFLALYFDLSGNGSVDQMSEIGLAFMALPFGLLTCYIVYHICKQQFEKKKDVYAMDQILDEGFDR